MRVAVALAGVVAALAVSGCYGSTEPASDVAFDHATLNGRTPPEFGLLGLSPEPYTVADMLAVGRLAGTDINWLAYFSLLAERGNPGFARLWQRTLEAGAGLAEPGGNGADPKRAALGSILTGVSRSGPGEATHGKTNRSSASQIASCVTWMRMSR